MAEKIDNCDDVIDSREVVARIDELQAEKDAHEDPEASHSESWADSDPDAAQELEQLNGWYWKLRDVGGDTPEDGLTLVRETYWVDYVKELAEETSEIDFSKLTWPLTCIDWEQAARELQMDYTSVDFDGITYYVR